MTAGDLELLRARARRAGVPDVDLATPAELERALERVAEASADPHTRALTERASAIEPRPLDPVWPGVLWAGKPTLIAGDPGLGKSMVTCDIAARVTTGAPWPCSTERRPPAEVVMLSAEDDPADTLVPRLMAAGADLARVTFVGGVLEQREDGPRKTWLSLDRHIAALGDVLRGGRVRLLIVDPLSAYLGRDTDSHNEGDVRTVLAGLAELAAAHRCAVLAVRHLRKSESSTAQSKIIGSIAFTAAARAVYVVARDPDDEDRRLLLCAKNNLAPDSAGYAYAIDATDEGVPYVVWSPDRETRTADEVLGAAPDQMHAIDAVERWLAEVLADGPIPSRRMRELAADAGHSWRTVERARARMGGIVIERDVIAGQGARGPWQWRLTPPRATPPDPAMSGGGLGGAQARRGFQGHSDRQTATPPYIGDGGGVDVRGDGRALSADGLALDAEGGVILCRACDGEGCSQCEGTGLERAA